MEQALAALTRQQEQAKDRVAVNLGDALDAANAHSLNDQL
jgi:hypothetical protein